MKLLIFCFFAISISLIIQVVLRTTDVNDAWILDGLIPYFLLLTLVYSVVVSFSRSMKLTVMITAIYIVVVNSIPNLKYAFIYGLYDSLGHYGFIKDLTTSGHIPEAGIYASQYESTPGMQSFVSTLSLATGVDTLVAIKIFLIITPFLYPLTVYLVLKKIDLSPGLARVIIASTTITCPTMYIYTGTRAIYPIYVLFVYLCLIFVSLKRDNISVNPRGELIVAVVAGTAIVISHDVTSFFLLSYMLLFLLFLLISKMVKPSKTFIHAPVSFTLMFVVLTFIHFTFHSESNLVTIFSSIKNSLGFLFGGMQKSALGQYETFFQLTIFDQLRILTIKLARDAIIAFLVLLAPLVLLKLHSVSGNSLKFYNALVIPTVLAVLVFFSSVLVRSLVPRGVYYLAAFSPFLAGLTLFYLIYSKHHRFRHVILTLVVFSLICVSSLQTFTCQPLIPTVSQSNGNYYVVDWRQVSTIYARSLVFFASTHDSRLNFTIAHRIMRWQIYGLTSSNFQSLFTWDSAKAPLILAANVGTSQTIPSAKEAIANEQYLQNALQNIGIVYNNGKSYVFLNTTVLQRTAKKP